jgi:hypothetical protein
LACSNASPRTEGNLRKITPPLIYSVLALGALYEDGFSDHAYWAKEWFAKAREGVNQASEECCFEICLAVYFLVCSFMGVVDGRLLIRNMLLNRILLILFLERRFGWLIRLV